MANETQVAYCDSCAERMVLCQTSDRRAFWYTCTECGWQTPKRDSIEAADKDPVWAPVKRRRGEGQP